MTTPTFAPGRAGGLLILVALGATALPAASAQPASVLARDAGETSGKIEDRLPVIPAAAALPQRRVHLPAAMLMPMLLDWGTPAAEEVLVASAAPRETAARPGVAQVVRRVPVARPAAPAAPASERRPEPVLAAASVADIRQPQDSRSGWRGLALAANALDRVTGTVIAAGGWAIGSTASLLPDWR